MGVFINIIFNADQIEPAMARQLAATCPVDIFAVDGDDHLRIQQDEVDECTLCGLCLKIAPAGALTIQKLYKDEQLVSQGATR
jgi:NAD-dependent dihydropyrimidine dehydrogenase PreA subunit